MQSNLKPKILTIIPARGGSKGIPQKNIKTLCGKPLIVWTIETALLSGFSQRVIVSTDDERIAEISRRSGAEVPFLRPAELASDDATSLSVVLHVLENLTEGDDNKPDLILFLQPTSPFRTIGDIQASLHLLEEKSANAVVSVTEAIHPVSWYKTIGPGGELISIEATEPEFRRQDGKIHYQPNGAIYWITRQAIEEEKTFLPSKTIGYVMPAERSLDIDTPWDFYLAELIMKDSHATSKV